ncbi:MAG TPA: hypothetical protein VF883_02390 [Thermoanaerobaculia bacterium]
MAKRRIRLNIIDVSWMIILSLALAAGFTAVAVHALDATTFSSGVRQLAVGWLLSGAAAATGGLAGFLFGIPRTLQSADTGPDAEGADAKSPWQRYRGNTNLEQISDWLTKILVGVGLTQLTDAPSFIRRVSSRLGPAFGAANTSEPFVIAVLIFFLTSGFLVGYLWTRLFLAGALVRADLNSVVQRVEERLDAQEEAVRADATALALTHSYLQQETSVAAVDVGRMKESIKHASPSVRVQIFYKAQEVRARTWRDQKRLMERTIPIFEALVEADVSRDFHQNRAQLGFALKDKREPDWVRAERELSEAIEIRGADTERWWILYEYNRSVCRIMLDEQFHTKTASADSVREGIMADLAKVNRSGYSRLLNESPVADWVRLNGGEIPG